MNKINKKLLFIINIIFAAPIIILIVSELIFTLVIIPLKYYNNGIGDIFGFPAILAYYFLPYIGWGAIVPITTSLIGTKSEKGFLARIFLGLLMIVYLGILVYTIWWWLTKQQFIWL